MENTNYNALMSDKIDLLAAALSKAQGEIENVFKSQQGRNHKYADLAACLDAIKKPFADNKLSIVQLLNQDDNKMPILITMLLHESGQWLKSIFPIEKVIITSASTGKETSNVLQQLGAGITYVRRYALTAIVGLAQEDDDAASIPIKPTNIVKEQRLVVAHQLRSLCDEHQLNSTEFAKFHNISSKEPETLIRGVENFDKLKEQYQNSFDIGTNNTQKLVNGTDNTY